MRKKAKLSHTFTPEQSSKNPEFLAQSQLCKTEPIRTCHDPPDGSKPGPTQAPEARWDFGLALQTVSLG